MRLIGKGAEVRIDVGDEVLGHDPPEARGEVEAAAPAHTSGPLACSSTARSASGRRCSARLGCRSASAPCAAGTADAAVLHHDDEGSGLALGDQVVHDQARPALAGPARLVLAAAVLEIQHGIAGGRILVIVRRCVDEDATRRIGDLGGVEDLSHLSVGDVLECIEVLILGGTLHAAAATAGPVEVQAAGVRYRGPVDPDLVVVEALVLGLGLTAGPHAVLALGQGVSHGPDVELDLLGLGRGDARADPAVRGDLGILFSRLIEGRGSPVVRVLACLRQTECSREGDRQGQYRQIRFHGSSPCVLLVPEQ